MTEPQVYPLAWPPAWPRTARPQRAIFKTSLARARDGLRQELRLLGARDVVISSNARVNRYGEITSPQKLIADPGVAVYFTLHGQPRCVPCDTWDRLEDNLHAIELTIAALRGIARWGASEMVDAAFAGFQALPAGGESGWWEVLEVDPGASLAQITDAYRQQVRRHHPDAGGDHETFLRISTAFEHAKAAKGL